MYIIHFKKIIPRAPLSLTEMAWVIHHPFFGDPWGFQTRWARWARWARWVWFLATRAGQNCRYPWLCHSANFTRVTRGSTSTKTGGQFFLSFGPPQFQALFPNAAGFCELHMQQLGDIRMIQVPRQF